MENLAMNGNLIRGSNQNDFLQGGDASVIPSPPQLFSELVVFGDSLSETGNIFDATFGLFPPNPPYFAGRFSNGPIWVDFIAPELGLTSNEISNFAFGGALSGYENLSDAFLPSLNFPGLLDQIDAFAAEAGANGADPNALYVVWAGSNDFRTLTDPLAVATAITNAVTNLATSITALANLGAETIVVPNVPDLGILPGNLDAGIVSEATAVSVVFNQALDQTLDNLEQTLGIDAIEVDTFSFIREITTSSEEFSFTNVTEPLIQQPGSVNPNEFVFFDDVHPTTRVHELFTDVILTALNNTGCSINSNVEDDLLNHLQGDRTENYNPESAPLSHFSAEIMFDCSLGSLNAKNLLFNEICGSANNLFFNEICSPVKEARKNHIVNRSFELQLPVGFPDRIPPVTLPVTSNQA
jgi:phospholipase/lecithinase/hemolysin